MEDVAAGYRLPPAAPCPRVRVYAPPRANQWLCAAGLVFFLGMTVAGVWLPLANSDGSFARPVTAAVVLGCFWGGWTVLSVLLLAAYRRMRVYVSDEAVQVVGLFRTRAFALASVTRAVWRGWPVAGSVVLHGPAGRAVIEFASYTGGSDLAQFLRAALPAEVQDRYERFEAMSVPGSEAFRRRQDRERRVAAALMPVLGVALIGLAIWDP